MKYFRLLVALLILTVSITADEKAKLVTMGDFDLTKQGFSFALGELVTADVEAENLTNEIDFIFDLPNGLGMNNSELTDWFTGQAQILDLGEIPLDKKPIKPEGEFSSFLIPDEIVVGHTYLIKTSMMEEYGRIQIVEFDNEKSLLTFKWVFTGESR